MLHSGMYPVPAPSRAYHPCFTQDSVQAILVVPQGCTIVNSKPYPACLFFWRGRVRLQMPLGYKYQYCSGGGENISISVMSETPSAGVQKGDSPRMARSNAAS